MALDTYNVLNSVVQVLVNNTSTIAASLTVSSDIKLITAGDAREAPVTLDQYPCILVKLTKEIEEFTQFGQRNNKHELEFEIASLLYSSVGHVTSEKEIITMSRGIKAVLKSNITLSSTALWSIPETVDYFPAELDGTYLSASLIMFRTHHLST